jgi:hypothetical protein
MIPTAMCICMQIPTANPTQGTASVFSIALSSKNYVRYVFRKTEGEVG